MLTEPTMSTTSQMKTADFLDNLGTAVGLAAFAPYGIAMQYASVDFLIAALLIGSLAVILKFTALVLTRLRENRFYDSTRVETVLPASYRDNKWEAMVPG